MRPAPGLAPGPEMACRVCQAVLNVSTGPGPQVNYLHPLRAGGYDHDPEPVPATELAAVVRRCDFCSDQRPLFQYATAAPVRTVALGPHTDTVHDFGSLWSVCPACATLVQGRRVEPLWRRAMAGLGWSPTDVAAQATRTMQATVLAALRPGRTVLTATAWPHTRLGAEALPRVRDRLAGLLGGPDGLTGPLAERPVRAAVATGLAQAGLFWVDEQFTDLVAHATTGLPATPVTAQDVPVPHGLLVWAFPVGTGQVCAASWTALEDGQGWELVAYRSLGAGLDPPALQTVREQVGWLLPVTHTRLGTEETVAADHWCAPLVATWLLIAQRLAQTSPAPLPRAALRAYTRAGRPAPEVRLVHLDPRPATGAAPGAGNTTGRQATERGLMTSRVWVRGFWRQQAHGPGRALRKTIYVHPHLRGPADAPIDAATTVRVLATARHPAGGDTSR